MVEFKLYVEGGGTSNILRTECRSGFSAFLEKAGLKGKMPRIVACGSRGEAFDKFCTAIKQNQRAFLLVDSEESVQAQHAAGSPENWKPWEHLRQRSGDEWEKPDNAADTDCHLMVEVMESWFLADKPILSLFFGQGFAANSLPARSDIEAISKDAVYQYIEKASKKCKTKACYGKGQHSFKILAQIDPAKVYAASPWAKRFIDELKK